MPDWFKVGVSVWFMGFGLETIVISIDENVIDDEDASWIGRDVGGDHLYPLDEVSRYWKLQHVDWRSEIKKGK